MEGRRLRSWPDATESFPAHLNRETSLGRLPGTEGYKSKMVEAIRFSTKEERVRWIEQADFNLFSLDSDKVIVDLLTDSGTGAMSDKQWAELMTGDESYAGSQSFIKLSNTVKSLTGLPYFLPTHQGRGAENVLFSAMIKEGDVVPGNKHFDTTQAHIELRKARAIDCTIEEAYDIDVLHPFKGNIDVEKLEEVFKTYPKDKIPLCMLTITNNSVGGQPVSMDNICSTRELCDKYGIRLFFDAARFAENAYFIKRREHGYQQKEIKEIVLEMFSHVDGATMSGKKDGLVNIGGFIVLRDEKIFQVASKFTILYEGYISYGGMSGRDMAAFAQGLDEATELHYLHSRVEEVQILGEELIDFGVPVQKPIGGHAIFVDALRVLPNIPQSQFPAQTLAIELYKHAGVRGVEIGTLLADRDPITRENRYPKNEFLRLAIPRRVLSFSQLHYVAVALKQIYDRRHEFTKGYEITWEQPIMRHFTVKLKQAGAIGDSTEKTGG
ncbi:unnamed protein product [Cyprideis torosa]|uniref:Aromatic amino acid beta-eliminating lyase/threonine aldolase domain-containing protein n=1 Tax=Cyprideis torosa TaxID=163714 RepID=A0A7R8W5B1_9CRUS|nr:unnamed protein product [Cyprideis torosa]CAG0884975.1 unnamed protein product [Cyprideis torosa]